MIWSYVAIFFVAILDLAFSNLPQVSVLPTVNGVDLDTTLQQAVAYFHTITQTMWYLGDVWTGALILLGYYSLKMLLRFVLGNRAPGQH